MLIHYSTGYYIIQARDTHLKKLKFYIRPPQWRARASDLWDWQSEWRPLSLLVDKIWQIKPGGPHKRWCVVSRAFWLVKISKRYCGNKKAIAIGMVWSGHLISITWEWKHLSTLCYVGIVFNTRQYIEVLFGLCNSEVDCPRRISMLLWVRSGPARDFLLDSIGPFQYFDTVLNIWSYKCTEHIFAFKTCVSDP